MKKNINKPEANNKVLRFEAYKQNPIGQYEKIWSSTSENEYDLELSEDLSDLVYEIDYANLAAADDPECMADLYMDEFGLKKTDFKLDEYGNFDLKAGEPLLTIENKEAEIMKEMSTSELMDHCNRVLDLFGDGNYELYAVVYTSLNPEEEYRISLYDLDFTEDGGIDLSTKAVLHYIEQDFLIEDRIQDLLDMEYWDLDEIESLLSFFEAYEGGTKEEVEDYKKQISELRDQQNNN